MEKPALYLRHTQTRSQSHTGMSLSVIGIILVSAAHLSSAAQNYDVRIVGGGVLQVYLINTWHYVCSTVSTKRVGEVTCAQRNLQLRRITSIKSPGDEKSSYITALQCSEKATHLANCKSGGVFLYCDPLQENQVAAVACGSPSDGEGEDEGDTATNAGTRFTFSTIVVAGIVLGVVGGLATIALVVYCVRRGVKDVRYRSSGGDKDGIPTRPPRSRKPQDNAREVEEAEVEEAEEPEMMAQEAETKAFVPKPKPAPRMNKQKLKRVSGHSRRSVKEMQEREEGLTPPLGFDTLS